MSEIVREKILKLIHDEVPHGVGVEIISMKYDDQKIDIILRGIFL